MERIEGGRAHCALCGEGIRPGEDALLTPDFLADEADPFWPRCTERASWCGIDERPL
jgi:hypothetical protein